MSLIIALILGCYLFSRCSFEKHTKKELERRTKDKCQEWDRFWEKYSVSTEILRSKWAEANSERDWDNWHHGEQLPDHLIEYRKIRNDIILKAGINPTSSLVACGVLAQQGKIPLELTWNGIRVYYENKNFLLPFVKWYDEELRKHGIEYPMLYHDPYSKYSDLKYGYIPIQQISIDMVINGACGWIDDWSPSFNTTYSHVFFEDGF